MGQHAEDYFSGRVCSWCGEWFEEQHGHPVTCEACFDPDDEDCPPKAYNRTLEEKMKEQNQ